MRATLSKCPRQLSPACISAPDSGTRPGGLHHGASITGPPSWGLDHGNLHHRASIVGASITGYPGPQESESHLHAVTSASSPTTLRPSPCLGATCMPSSPDPLHRYFSTLLSSACLLESAGHSWLHSRVPRGGGSSGGQGVPTGSYSSPSTATCLGPTSCGRDTWTDKAWARLGCRARVCRVPSPEGADGGARYSLVDGLQELALVLPDFGVVDLLEQLRMFVDQPRFPEDVGGRVLDLGKDKEGAPPSGSFSQFRALWFSRWLIHLPYKDTVLQRSDS